MLLNRFFGLILLASLTVGLTGCQPSPGGTVRSFFVDLEKGEINEATDALSNSSVDGYMGSKIKMALSEVPASFDERGGIKNIEILDENVNGDLATVSYRINFKDDTSEEGVMDLVKEDDGWKIDPMSK